MFGLGGKRGVLPPTPATKTRIFLSVIIIHSDSQAVSSNPESTLKHLNSSNNIFTQVPGVCLRVDREELGFLLSRPRPVAEPQSP